MRRLALLLSILGALALALPMFGDGTGLRLPRDLCDLLDVGAGACSPEEGASLWWDADAASGDGSTGAWGMQPFSDDLACQEDPDCHLIRDADADGDICDDIRSVRNAALWPGGVSTTEPLVRFRWSRSLAGREMTCSLASNHDSAPVGKAISVLHFAASATAPGAGEEPLADGTAALAPTLRFEGEDGWRLHFAMTGDGTDTVSDSLRWVAVFLFGDAHRDGADGAVTLDVRSFPEITTSDNSLALANISSELVPVIGDGVNGRWERLTYYAIDDEGGGVGSPGMGSFTFLGYGIWAPVAGLFHLERAEVVGPDTSESKVGVFSGQIDLLSRGPTVRLGIPGEFRFGEDYPDVGQGNCGWGSVAEAPGICWGYADRVFAQGSGTASAVRTEAGLGLIVEMVAEGVGSDGSAIGIGRPCRPNLTDPDLPSLFRGSTLSANADGFAFLVGNCPGPYSAATDALTERQVNAFVDMDVLQDFGTWDMGEGDPLGWAFNLGNRNLITLGPSFRGIHTGGGFPIAECHQGGEGPEIIATWDKDLDLYSLSRDATGSTDTGKCWDGAAWVTCGQCSVTTATACGVDSDCPGGEQCDLDPTVLVSPPATTVGLHFYGLATATLGENVTGTRGCRMDFLVSEADGRVRAALYQQPSGTVDGFGALQCNRNPDSGAGDAHADIKLGADLATDGESERLAANFHVRPGESYAIRVRNPRSDDCPNGASCACDEIPAFDLRLDHFNLNARAHPSAE